MNETSRVEPKIILMTCDNPIHSSESPEPVLTWTVGSPHPLARGMNVVAMYLSDGLVEIYSVVPNSQKSLRDSIPVSRVRLFQEIMSFDVFNEELARAESGAEDDEEEEDEEEEETGGPEAPPQNAQNALNGSNSNEPTIS